MRALSRKLSPRLDGGPPCVLQIAPTPREGNQLTLSPGIFTRFSPDRDYTAVGAGSLESSWYLFRSRVNFEARHLIGMHQLVESFATFDRNEVTVYENVQSPAGSGHRSWTERFDAVVTTLTRPYDDSWYGAKHFADE